jgi:hypothetical protein
LKVQELLDICSEHLEAEAKEEETEAPKEKEGKKDSPVHN